MLSTFYLDCTDFATSLNGLSNLNGCKILLWAEIVEIHCGYSTFFIFRKEGRPQYMPILRGCKWEFVCSIKKRLFHKNAEVPGKLL